jgi:N-dimethylarginine dimethylaminohydrolase
MRELRLSGPVFVDDAQNMAAMLAVAADLRETVRRSEATLAEARALLLALASDGEAPDGVADGSASKPEAPR